MDARVRSAHRIDAVVHFAAFKAVGESRRSKPLAYYANNIGGLLTLARRWQRTAARRFVFSSSATVYGKPETLPIREDAPLCGDQPLRRDQADGREHPARPGARRSGLADRAAALLQPGRRARERPDRRGPARHPEQPDAVCRAGRRRASATRLQVFGNDYDTPDGTGVRDYIHVVDLAEGHVAALRHLLDRQRSITVNLGTGRGYSVLELVARLRARQRPRGALRDRRAAARAMSTPATPIRRWRASCSAGRPRAISTRCAPTAGAGSAMNPTATAPPRA